MSRAADVYSYAMIMWELFACKRLYEGHIASQVILRARCPATLAMSHHGDTLYASGVHLVLALSADATAGQAEQPNMCHSAYLA